MTQRPKTPADFWARVTKGEGCWEYDGYHNPKGYGKARMPGHKGGMMNAHRVAYLLTYGSIPEGMHLDHYACDNKGCVNPDHVRPVTPRENSLRCDSVAALNLAKTHCKHGHEFTPENTGPMPKGRRFCRTCKDVWSKSQRTTAYHGVAS